MARLSLWSLLLICVSLVPHASAACYYRNGTATTSDYSPCSADASNPLNTVCCARWDTCLPNGLCQSTIDNKIYRESCTKQNWDEKGCQELCSNERPVQKDTDVVVTPCSGNSTSIEWCCGQTDECCKAGSSLPRYSIAAKFGDPLPSPTSSSTRSSSATASVSSASGTFSPAPAASTGLSTGAKAGVGIGVAFGVIALVALAFFVYKALQWRRTANPSSVPYELPEQHDIKEIYSYQQDTKHVAQLAGVESEVHEMPNSHTFSDMHPSSARPQS